MRAAAALSEHPLATHAVGEVAGAILESLTEPVSVVFAFIEASHTGSVEDISGALQELLAPDVLVGATGCGVIGQSDEVEDRASLSVWAATGLAATALRFEPGASHPVGGWPKPTAGHAVLLADPFSCRADRLLESAAEECPDLAFHGGFASAAQGPGGNRLIVGSTVHTDGAVGVILDGAPMQSIVSQGCRPVGEPFIATGVDGNLITELGSQPSLDRLRTLAASVSEDERHLLSQGLHIGVVIDESRAEFGRGDFLIRGVLGAEPETGAIAVGDVVPLGSTVQFQVRDADSASEDLHELLTGVRADAALAFTCNGRGVRLFGRAGHDSEAVHGLTGSAATAGMFCAGELGPIGGVNHLHGFTVSSLLFGS